MTANKWQIDPEEQAILDAYNRGEYQRVGDLEAEKLKAKKMAGNTLKRLRKERVISLRLSDTVYQGIKAKAAAKGLPYQTLVSSLLHQYVTGQLQAQL